MKVVMSYCHKDYNLAFYAIKVMQEKTNVDMNNVFLYRSAAAPNPPPSLNCNLMISQKDNGKYPFGPNMMFANLMLTAVQNFQEPMFMCEADGFPTCPDWYDRVKTAHEETGERVSGSLVDWVEPIHLNGNMVIDPTLVTAHPCLGRPVMLAWDCHHAELLLSVGADNAEIFNPDRKRPANPTSWWFSQAKNGKIPAWIHGCQSFQAWEHIDGKGFDESV